MPHERLIHTALGIVSNLSEGASIVFDNGDRRGRNSHPYNPVGGFRMSAADITVLER